jgi:hypothetical protein
LHLKHFIAGFVGAVVGVTVAVLVLLTIFGGGEENGTSGDAGTGRSAHEQSRTRRSGERETGGSARHRAGAKRRASKRTGGDPGEGSSPEIRCEYGCDEDFDHELDEGEHCYDCSEDGGATSAGSTDISAPPGGTSSPPPDIAAPPPNTPAPAPDIES